MMELKIKSWEQCSIANWRRIKDIVNDDALEETAKNVAVLAILCGVEENEIWNLPMNEVKPLFAKMGFLSSFDFPKDVKFRKIKIGDTKCEVQTDLQKMTIAQYVDFQTYWKDFEKNIGYVLSCFLIPEGCTYGDGYDVAEFAQKIEDNLSIVQSNALCFFFLKNWVNSIRGMQIFLEWVMKKNRKDPRMQEIQREYQKMMDMYGSL